MVQVRRDLVSAFKKNREKAKASTAYSEMLEGQSREHSSRWRVCSAQVHINFFPPQLRSNAVDMA